MGSLLKEAERRGEVLQVELSSQVLEVERSKADMEELLQHNARLQRDSEEHQALKGAYNTLLNRSDLRRFCMSTKGNHSQPFSICFDLLILALDASQIGSAVDLSPFQRLEVMDASTRSSSQVQRQRASAEGPAGRSHLALQTERLSEEEP